MKAVIFLAVALTLAVCVTVFAANSSTSKSTSANTSSNVSTGTTGDTTNNANNATSPTNTKWNKNETWNKNAKNANKDVNTSDNAGDSTQQLLKVSHEGFAAIRAIRAARVAIFNGQPKTASKLLTKASTDLQTATKNAPMFVAAAEATANGKVVADAVEVGKVNWIPIDGQVSLGDTFVVTKEKKTHIEKANQHFKKGESKEAIEELRLAAITVSCTRVMMPLSSTSNWVAEATRLLSQQKYYEANLALKAAEDGLVVNTTNVVDMPQVKTDNTRQPN